MSVTHLFIYSLVTLQEALDISSLTTCAGKKCHARRSAVVTELLTTWYIRRHAIVTKTKTTCLARLVGLLPEHRSSLYCIVYNYQYLTHILKWKAKVKLTILFRQIEKENLMVVIVIVTSIKWECKKCLVPLHVPDCFERYHTLHDY